MTRPETPPPTSALGRLVVVDDDAALRSALRRQLARAGWAVSEAGTVAEAKAICERTRFDAAILDHELPDGESLDVLREVQRTSPRARVVVLTGHASIDLAVTLVKAGAYDFLVKPPNVERLASLLRPPALPESDDPARASDFSFGRSAAMMRLADDLQRLRSSDHPVLLLGETGTGKSVIARRIHAESGRAGQKLLELNCATLTRELVENELFGHERGAFTGANAAKAGLLEVAAGGTVFLDEIGDIEPAVQAKVLRALEDRKFRRVGGTTEREVDARWIFATHADLLRAVREGGFRSDLFYRISTVTLTVPPLRERREDVEPIARTLLRRRTPVLDLSPEAVAMLEAHPWPGNVRELRNVLDRASLGAIDGVIRPADLRFDATPETPAVRLQGRMSEIEREAIVAALEAAGGRVAAAAQALGIPRSTLYQRVRDLRIDLQALKR